MTAASTDRHHRLSSHPDGRAFRRWADLTDYRRELHVDQQHPAAADTNPGTEEAPLATIQRAAELVEPGERVLIKSGTYREWIRPRRGGSGADGMISFEAPHSAPNFFIAATTCAAQPSLR